MDVTHLVFDLGGVIVELRGLPIRPEWFPEVLQPEQVWQKWLESAGPREFEAGKIDQREFSRRVVDELALTVDQQTFLDYFKLLPVGPFPGARELVQSLKPKYQTALFSNSNEIHWQRKMLEMDLGPVFDHHFASHLMGFVKPDRQAFETVVSTLSVAPEQILFFDDNQLNVDAALKLGIRASKVVGLEELRSSLDAYGINY